MHGMRDHNRSSSAQAKLASMEVTTRASSGVSRMSFEVSKAAEVAYWRYDA